MCKFLMRFCATTADSDLNYGTHRGEHPSVRIRPQKTGADTQVCPYTPVNGSGIRFKAKPALTTILLTLLLPLIGCSNSSNQSSIIGKWEQSKSSDYSLFLVSEQLEFHEDGTYYAPGMFGGTYSLPDDEHIQLTAQLANAPLETVTYKLTLDGDSLTLLDEGSGVALEFTRTGPPSEVLPPTLHPSPSSTPIQ